MSDETRALSSSDQAVIARARDKAFVLYEGEQVAHRSCGIALAETFDLPSRPYQSLRRGGITGCGACGAIRAGEQVLGELLGDPDPAGPVTDALRRAAIWYQQQAAARIDRGASPDIICNHLTAPLGDFHGAARKRFCTALVAEVAALTAEALLRFAPADLEIRVPPLATDTDADADARA
ncbi:hypothetical protein [Haliangium ochraceum]|uniref:Uncharacterized protein n=1 Tax=Haliangium ochraceum (strain DSM 14365 / JCM 11303 / SMP-2) TaxID=502025 RepID=D0LH90_HALO1|nr:hypothetical protein [Haliangium ochraceum]ACY18235.1 hypothetical protein Hoch_5758 [Haliangium ochraceum DSM 14365]